MPVAPNTPITGSGSMPAGTTVAGSLALITASSDQPSMPETVVPTG